MGSLVVRTLIGVIAGLAVVAWWFGMLLFGASFFGEAAFVGVFLWLGATIVLIFGFTKVADYFEWF
jgi:hypothetical protein